MFATGQERPDAASENRLASDRDRVERSAVKRIPHRNCFEAAGGGARQLDGHADGAGSAGGEEDAIQIAGRQFRELLGQANGRSIGVTAGTEGEFSHLFGNRLDDAGMSKTHLVHVVAVEVEQLAPLPIAQQRPAAAF
jgi:hypothetical protein